MRRMIFAMAMVGSGGAGLAAEEIELSNCLIAPERSVDLSGRTTGLISEVLVDVGDVVEEGQLLARLDAIEELAGLALAELDAADESGVAAAARQVEIEKDSLDRAKELQRRGVVSADGVNEREATYAARVTEQERAEALLRRATLQLNLAKARVALKEVRAPNAGVVTHRFLEPGEFLNESAHLLRLVQLDQLKVEVLADQSLYGPAIEAETFTVTPEIGPEKTVGAADVVIDPLIDPASGTFRIVARIDNADSAIVSGQRCRIAF